MARLTNEFAMLQMFHLGVLNKLANIDQKMEADATAHLQKNHTGRDQQPQEDSKEE